MGWSFCLFIFIYFTKEIESFIFFYLRTGWKYLIQYLFYIYFNLLKLWITFLFPLWLVAIYLFHPSFPQNIYFQKNSSPPPPNILNYKYKFLPLALRQSKNCHCLCSKCAPSQHAFWICLLNVQTCLELNSATLSSF